MKRESESQKERWLRILWKGTKNSRKKLENEEKDREQGRSRTTLFFFFYVTGFYHHQQRLKFGRIINSINVCELAHALNTPK